MADAVKCTLGPQGKCVIIKEINDTPHVTKDGVTVAKSIQLPDMLEDTGVQLVREAALKTLNSVGDATTTSTVLAQALVERIENDIVSGKIDNFAQYKAGIRYAADDISNKIRKSAKKVKNSDDVKNIAFVSANNDMTIGKLISVAFDKVGEDGIITVEESKNVKTSFDVINGMQFNNGYLAPHFITDQAKGECVLENPYIFLSDQKVLRTKDIVPILEPLAREGKSILLIAEEFDDEVIENLKLNKLQNILKCCAIKAPSFGDYRKDILEDLAILTDGKAITYDSGIEVYDTKLEDLGKAKKIIVTKDTCTIIDGAGNKINIQERANLLKAQLEIEQKNPNKSEFVVELLKNRIAKLVSGVFMIHVGGTTEIEMKEKKDRYDDAICATRAAIEEGVVPGGGINFLKIQDVPMGGKNSSFDMGVHVINSIKDVVFKQILVNADADYNEILPEIDPSKNIGFDAGNYKVCNFIRNGIINPAKSDRLAFENAVSVAMMYLSTACAIVPYEIMQINNP